MKPLRACLCSAGVALLCAGAAVAQAPPGPIAPAPSTNSADAPPAPPPPRILPRKNILGSWRLNRDDSDDPRARSNERKVNDPNSGHGGYGGPRVGWPGGGIGGPGIGGGQHGGGNPQKDNPEEHERYRELVDPSVRLRLERKGDSDPLITMFGDAGRKTVFYTNGQKPSEPEGVGTDVVEARWDGGKLVSEAQLPKKGSMRRTYEISPDGMQLYEEVELVTGKDKNPSAFRFVYDAVNGDNF